MAPKINLVRKAVAEALGTTVEELWPREGRVKVISLYQKKRGMQCLKTEKK